MNKMKRKLFALLLTTATLVACNSNQTPKFKKTIVPSGAPVLAFYDRVNTDRLDVKTPSVVKAQLLTNDYGMVVFDFYNGLKTLKENKGNFKLGRIITGGNLFIVGIGDNNKDYPTKDDYIVSFNQNSLPDMVYRYLYGDDIANSTHYEKEVSGVLPVLKTGMHQGNSVDYVVIANPALFAGTHDKEAKTYGKTTVVANIREDWENATGQKAFPQAGLFINTMYSMENPSFYLDELALIDDRIDTCIDDVDTMKRTIDQLVPEKEQQTIIGFTSQVAYNVQKEDNGFALVRADEGIDIAAFFTTLGITEDFSEYIL